MSRERSFLGVLICTLLLTACLFHPGSRASAQVICDCPPDQMRDVTLRVCVGGANRTIVVSYCNTNYCPPQPDVQPCNPDNLPINARTVIRKVCIVDGGPALANAQDLMDAAIVAMSICCNDYQFFPPCEDPQAPFHWIVTIPLCVQFDAAAQCVWACDDSPCCTHLVRFTQTASGTCETRVLKTCDDQRDCPTADCIRLACRYPVKCCL